MKARWTRWAAIALAALALYAALGFWLAPWVLQRELVAYARDQLQRQASIGRVTVNPFTLRVEASDLKLAEANGAPIASAARIAVQMQWRSLVSRAWRFADIQFDAPAVSVVIVSDGRLNLAELADAATRGRAPAADASLPRFVIDRLAMAGGVLDLQDRQAGYANTLTPIDFELTGLSTLPDRNDDYTFTAKSKQGGTVRWQGHASLNPIRAGGQLVIEDAALPELSVYLQSRVRAKIAAGKLSAVLPYAAAYGGGKFEARLVGAQVSAQDLAFAHPGATESFAALGRVAATGIDADIIQRAVSIAEVRAENGRVAVHRDSKGQVDLANIAIASTAPPAPPADGAAAKPLAWKATVSKMALERIALAAVDETVTPPLKMQVASVGAQTALQASQSGERLDLKLSGTSLALADIAASRGNDPPLKLARLGFDGGTLDLASRRAALERVYAEGGELRVTRRRDGAIDLASWIPKGGSAPSGKAQGPDWVAEVRTVQAGKIDVDLADEASGVKLRVAGARAQLEGAGTDLKRAVKFSAGFALREGGEFAGEGSIVPASGAVNAQVKASRIALKPLQPLLAQHLKLKIVGGTVSARGKLATGSGTRDQPAVRYDGDFDVAQLVINEIDNQLFGSWRSLRAPRVNVSVTPNRLDVPELRIAGADAKLIIEEDRSFNAARLLVKQSPAPSTTAAPARAPAPASADTARETFPVRIRRLRIQDAKLDFTDLSLRPQFSAKIHELNGVVNGLSTTRTARAQIELDGRVDEFGLARIRGETSLAVPKDNTDVNVVFRNVDMVPASPYSMKFAGYRIAQGKISLDLQYKIRNSKLEGDNRIVIEQLTLGERVESPDALKIPLQLAIAVLKDSDGRIDLGLPVTGDLSDPKFSYGAIIWKAITNVLTKIVTAPFRALGSLLGVSGEKLEAIDFDPGSGKLLPPEREKLRQVAQILSKRDSLKLSVPGMYSPAADGAALRALALRRDVAKKLDMKLEPGEEPGPLDFGDRNVRSALRDLYAQRFGDGELDKAKKAAESAAAAPRAGASAPAPQNLPLWQRAAKMIQGEPQVADASAFYTQLRERLEREHPLPADALAQLGTARAKAVGEALRAAGVDPSRFATSEPQATESAVGRPVPLKLGLAAR